MNPADIPGRHKRRGRHFRTERSKTADPQAARIGPEEAISALPPSNLASPVARVAVY